MKFLKWFLRNFPKQFPSLFINLGILSKISPAIASVSLLIFFTEFSRTIIQSIFLEIWNCRIHYIIKNTSEELVIKIKENFPGEPNEIAEEAKKPNRSSIDCNKDFQSNCKIQNCQGIYEVIVGKNLEMEFHEKTMKKLLG